MAPPSKMLKVGVIGPKGQCGSCVVDELMSRGHHAVGISRTPPKEWKPGQFPGKYSSVAVDVTNHVKLAEVFSSGFEAIVVAFGPSLADLSQIYRTLIESQGKIKTALLNSTHDGPFIIIGGAGSLHLEPHLQLTDSNGFAFSWWMTWPDAHLDYMYVRTREHGNSWLLPNIIILFKWARAAVKKTGMGMLFRPLASFALGQIKKFMTNPDALALITGSRIAYTMWSGVRDKSWSFLSPPGMLRDKGVRTGIYQIHIDTPDKACVDACMGGIYNEDMAVAIVDECENNKLAFTHWSCTGNIGLARW